MFFWNWIFKFLLFSLELASPMLFQSKSPLFHQISWKRLLLSSFIIKLIENVLSDCHHTRIRLWTMKRQAQSHPGKWTGHRGVQGSCWWKCQCGVSRASSLPSLGLVFLDIIDHSQFKSIKYLCIASYVYYFTFSKSVVCRVWTVETSYWAL